MSPSRRGAAPPQGAAQDLCRRLVPRAPPLATSSPRRSAGWPAARRPGATAAARARRRRCRRRRVPPRSAALWDRLRGRPPPSGQRPPARGTHWVASAARMGAQARVSGATQGYGVRWRRAKAPMRQRSQAAAAPAAQHRLLRRLARRRQLCRKARAGWSAARARAPVRKTQKGARRVSGATSAPNAPRAGRAPPRARTTSGAGGAGGAGGASAPAPPAPPSSCAAAADASLSCTLTRRCVCHRCGGAASVKHRGQFIASGAATRRRGDGERRKGSRGLPTSDEAPRRKAQRRQRSAGNTFCWRVRPAAYTCASCAEAQTEACVAADSGAAQRLLIKTSARVLRAARCWRTTSCKLQTGIRAACASARRQRLC
jgi:hypothetical protein